MQKGGEKLIWGVEKHFLLMMIFLLGWMIVLCLPGVAVPIGNSWWDYLALKGLELQVFSESEGGWLPFLLPIALLRVAHAMSGFGVDYFLAHALIAFSTMLFSYRAIYCKVSSSWRVPAFWALLVFSIIPVVVDKECFRSFSDANAVAYNGFYNRYLDIVFCLVLISVFACLRNRCEKNDNKWLIAFWCYALFVALLSKLTYFVVIWGVLWAFAILRQQRQPFLACGLAVIMVAALAVFFPSYYSTNWGIATVRGVSFSLWHLLLLGVAVLALSWLLNRQHQSFKAVLFLIVPLAAAWGIGVGNYGDLDRLRYAVAMAITLFLLGDMLRGAQISVGFRAGSGFTRELGFNGSVIVLVVTIGLLIYPLAILIRTTGVTIFAMAARAMLPAASFIEYPNLPGFFSHELFIAEEFRVSHIDRVRVLPVVLKRKRMKFGATFFTLYATDLDRTIGQLRDYQGSAITWVSFPGLSSQVFGVGRVPVGSRPWYLWGHEIGHEVHPDYAAIRESGDLVIIDRCNWTSGSILFREFFGVENFEKQQAVFNTVCFRAVRSK